MSKQNAEEQASPTALHRLTFILQHRYDDHLMSRVGVGFAQTRVMEALHDTIPHSQRDVADRLGQTEANVSRQLQLLRKHRLVSIAKNKKDGRQRDITLTKEGSKRLDQAQKLLKEHHDDLFRHLSDHDIKAFNRAVDNLLRAIKAPDPSE